MPRQVLRRQLSGHLAHWRGNRMGAVETLRPGARGLIGCDRLDADVWELLLLSAAAV